MSEFIKQLQSNEITAHILEVLQHGGTLGDLQGLTAGQLEGLYSFAYSQLMAKSYKNAEDLFKMLCLYSHKEFKYWLGLAIAQQEQNKLEEAVYSFSMSALMEPEHPVSALRSGVCLLKLKRMKEAKEALEVAQILAGLEPQKYQNYLNQAESYLAGLRGQTQ